MKKVLALVLCMLMLLSALTGCKFDEGDKRKQQEDKGAIIQLYSTAEIYNFDPLEAYIDDAAQQVLGLLYEGLFTINAQGKRVNALCKSYKIVDKDKEHYIEFKLRNSYWSDGRQVQAQDFVYAIKRMVESEAFSEAASMLMDVKNAYDIKHATGDKPLSIDDLGVTEEGVTVLRIAFDYKIDYEQFLDFLASPWLVPLREDCVNKAAEWASNPTIFVCNGPFFVRSFVPGDAMIIERNQYYGRDPEEDSIKKAVTPYRLKIDFHKDAAENLTDFLAGSVYYMGELPVDARTAQADSIKAVDANTMSEMTLLFNTKNELLANKDLRKALSISLDRQKIAEILVYASPATGIITPGVFENGSKNKTMFSEVSGNLISASADLNTAKSLIASAGASGKTITVTYRPTSQDEAVFQYIKGVWEGLGLTVKGVNNLTYEEFEDENAYKMYYNKFHDAYQSGDYEVMIYDLTMSSTDAFSTLAPFAKEFSGNKVMLKSFESDEVEATPHVSGYDSEAYNKLIADAFAIKEDRAAKTALLHDAEKMLVEDCPIAPLAVYQRYYLVSGELSNLKVGAYGTTVFTKVKLKDWEAKKAAMEEAEKAAQENNK